MISSLLSSDTFWFVFVAHFIHMTMMWLIRIPLKNYGMVDLGWPSGFFFITLIYTLSSQVQGNFWRRWVIAIPYLFCGLRFMYGWVLRNRKEGEDHRWQMWRDKWTSGKGIFGIRSHTINTFIFYHCQSFANIFVLTMPVAISSRSTKELSWVEIASIIMWVASFTLENVADAQLARFRYKSSNKGKVCKVGLWRYSRHPNYFFELMIWCSYALYAVSVCDQLIDYVVIVLGVPLVAYWFLVHFTGVPMTEEGSLKRRGEEYKKYVDETSMIVPWFPKVSKQSGN
ncbi:hypothetical protein AKO1_011356 [Acrasis kona]|uniref:Steroid 5-alpha reductase C-terminal domain-containing protein n=1 Tax=Acrasis kona TaxID=1008807 RepID=A0AAW2YYS3_9EUKA